LDNGAEGWGESLPRAYVSGESREQAFALLRDTILPALAGQSFGSLPEAVSFLEKCDGKAPPEGARPEVPQAAAGGGAGRVGTAARSRSRRPGAASAWPCWPRSARRPVSRPGRRRETARRRRQPR